MEEQTVEEIKKDPEAAQTEVSANASEEPVVKPIDMSAEKLIQEGDVVLVTFPDDVRYMIQVKAGNCVNIHRGKPLRVDDWIGKPFGSKVICEHSFCYLLNPTTEDFMMKASRESGIVYPKDAAFLMIRAGIKTGSKVLEIGTGSGSLTTAMAQMVAPTGKVHTYDRRTDLPKNAVKNIKRAGLEEYVSFNQRIAGEPFAENGYDAVILDIPQPWEEVDVVYDALRGGGKVVSLNPTFNQIEKMAEALRYKGFIQVEGVELIEREILARGGKTRPVMRMVGHTEFILTGTKVHNEKEKPIS